MGRLGIWRFELRGSRRRDPGSLPGVESRGYTEGVVVCLCLDPWVLPRSSAQSLNESEERVTGYSVHDREEVSQLGVGVDEIHTGVFP